MDDYKREIDSVSNRERVDMKIIKILALCCAGVVSVVLGSKASCNEEVVDELNNEDIA